MDGALGQCSRAGSRSATDYRILGWFENGFRHISNRLRPVRMPADLKGMRIRVLPSKVQAAHLRAAGRQSDAHGPAPRRSPMIKAGTIDAQENPLSNTVTYGVHKLHRFHTRRATTSTSRVRSFSIARRSTPGRGGAGGHAGGGDATRSRSSADCTCRRKKMRDRDRGGGLRRSSSSRPTSTMPSPPRCSRCSTRRAGPMGGSFSIWWLGSRSHGACRRGPAPSSGSTNTPGVWRPRRQVNGLDLGNGLRGFAQKVPEGLSSRKGRSRCRDRSMPYSPSSRPTTRR